MRTIKILLATTALFSAGVAQAKIIAISPSTFNDGNVFADGSQRGDTVTGSFDGGDIDFTGISITSKNTNNNILTTNSGGQAVFQGDLTGRGQSTFDLRQLNFISSTGATFGTVEFRLFGLSSNEDADIFLTDNFGEIFTFTTDDLRTQFGGGADRFAFQGIDNQSIASVSINSTSATGFQDLRQLRLSAAAAPVAPVPEPATWAMMLLGFGAIGFGMRRRKDKSSNQRVRLSYT